MADAPEIVLWRLDAARAIETLLYRYADAIDRGDYAGVGALFARGRIELVPDDPTSDVVGADAVEALYRHTTRRYPEGTPRSHHVTTNVIVDVDGESATATSRFTVFQATDGLALQPIIAGRYHDRFTHHDDGWWFAARRMEIILTGDLRQHLLIEIP